MKLNSYTEVLNVKWKHFYTVTIRMSRWSKVGEIVNNRVIVHPRTANLHSRTRTFYFDNVREAVAFAEDMRAKVLNHLEGKNIDCVNRGRTLLYPFTEKYMKIVIEDRDSYDYRYIDVLPYHYSIGLRYCQD